MVAANNKELLSWYLITLKVRETVHKNIFKKVLIWYLITLKLRQTVHKNISKFGPSNPSNPPATPNPNLPYSKPQILPLTNGESNYVPELIANQPYLNQDLNQELKEETLVQNSHAQNQKVQNPGIRTADSLPIPISRSPRNTWLVSIRQKLQEANYEENKWHKISIYRVSRSYQALDDQSFVPQMVSIGPFHHGKSKLIEMEPHKWRAFNRVLKRNRHDMHLYINAIQPLEGRARSCYEGNIQMGSGEFLLSLVLDGIFVLELFLGATKSSGFFELGYSINDPVFAMRGVMHAVRRDMILLENQIPLFVLDRLLATQLGLPDQPARIAKLAVCFLDPLMPTDIVDLDHMQLTDFSFDPLAEVGLHCLDTFRRRLLRIWRKDPLCMLKKSFPLRVADTRHQQFIHCVSELREAGIRCRKRQTDRFWDIRFDDDGILQIPRILIHNGTKSLFLNLIAFEQCHLDTSSNTVTSYVIFMDNLIKTEEDVRYLHDRGIIDHWLDDDKEVADLFNRLCQDIAFDFRDIDLHNLAEKINRYYSNWWNRRLYNLSSTLKHNYFSNPWAIISFVAATVLLLLTFLQTFYNVYAYYRPP